MKKVVLITGGSRGIGKSTAIEFAKNGYNIIINYLSDDKSAEHIKSFLVENYDVDVMTYKCDVKDELKVKCMVEDIINYFGRIDVLVNNAAIAIDTLVEDKNNFKKILDTNLIGPFILSRSVAKVMMKNKKGSIINVSSTNAIDTYYEYSLDYDASKAALISLTHNLAKYYAPYIRVNAVAPGWVDTDMNKNLSLDYIKKECEDIYLKRFGKPEEIAKAIYFLASDNASYITGEVLRVDGGYNHG